MLEHFYNTFYLSFKIQFNYKSKHKGLLPGFKPELTSFGGKALICMPPQWALRELQTKPQEEQALPQLLAFQKPSGYKKFAKSLQHFKQSEF